MRESQAEEALLSREELDALLEEMPVGSPERGSESGGGRTRSIDVDLQRANESFAFEQGLALSNRHQRVIHFSLIGQREIDVSELSELMLPTDLAGAFRVMPKAFDGFLLLSRPFFFHLLSMNFGAGPKLKAARPPTREYSRIERRFYDRAAREMLDQLERAWREVAPISLVWSGLASRASVIESEGGAAMLATFDVKGFSEACRVRVAIPTEPFTSGDGLRTKKGGASAVGISVLDVPLQLRAQVGTASMSLAEVGRLEPGTLIPLDAPSDGSVTVRIGNVEKFKGIPGTSGSKRAVQLVERLGASE